MKTKIFISAGLLCCFAVSFAIFTNIDGKWSGMTKTPDGNQIQLNYNFKTNNDKLTGMAQGDGDPYEIFDGKMKGDSLSFSVVVETGDTVSHKGKYYRAGDSISLSFHFKQGKFDLHTTLKRAEK